LPIIGRPGAISNGILATGHGMWGLQLAPLTGRLVAQIATGETPEHDITPLRPDRFSLRSRHSRHPHAASVAELGLGDAAVSDEALVGR
jgi:glycine/D-amino acid oxidase-like deaminating enzyme